MDIVDRIKELCVQKGTTVTNLEQIVSLGNGTIGKWRRQSPSVNNLALVADYLCVGLDYLVTGKADDSLFLSEREKELIGYFRFLSDTRQIKEVGRMGGIVEEIQSRDSMEAAEEMNISTDTKKKKTA
jgi:transcriptional regulator with XRE-family HTH domain